MISDPNKYDNIFSVNSDYDIITVTPFEQWDIGRYGKVVDLQVHDPIAKQKMLGFLKNTNVLIYNKYIAENSSADPDNFRPKKVEINEAGVGLVNDDSGTFPAHIIKKTFYTVKLSF